ncbi:MAG: hypothetical protein JW895_08005 [Thermoleophilaceae bacterium]|nr:hypothetical protein [Thermoleophilaceae bacterium]
MNAHLTVAAALAVLAAGSAEARLPTGGEPVKLDPADFTTRITNPWWPMRPGSRWVYRETDSEGARQRVVVKVTRRTRLIANGVTARVVRDVVTQRGRPVEVTDDWYAQDRRGNVWYLGEDTTEYEHGRPVSKEGSFEAGVDGAQPGVIMPARPRPGLRYRQEYYKGHAEDRARVVFRRGGLLMTNDVNPLQPKAVEYKVYARGTGPILSVGPDREELVSYRSGR